MGHQEGVILEGGLLRMDICPIDQLVLVLMQLL